MMGIATREALLGTPVTASARAFRDAETAFAARAWLRCTPEAIPEVAAVPTMLGRDERRFYYWLTAAWMAGAGEVVDLGAFVGGSTARLAAGHARAGHRGRIHAFDRFTAGAGIRRRLLSGRAPPQKGPDIFPLAGRLLSPWGERVRLVRGDIADVGWHGAPIEVLAIDAMKKVALIDRMVAAFFPALIPGRAIIVQQDMLHRAQPWIAALMQRLGDAVRPVAHVPPTSVAYLVEKPLTPARLAAARIGGITDDEMMEALDWTAARLSRWPVAARLERLRESVARNPGVRVAWQMT